MRVKVWALLAVFVVGLGGSAALDASEVLGVGTDALLGGDLTDIDNDGDEAAYAAPDDLGGFDAVFFSSDEPGFGGGEFAFNVFDNVLGPGNDKWCCGTVFPQIVGADFGDEQYLLTHFTVSSANDVPDRDPRVWHIEGSNDGENWTTIFTQDNPDAQVWTERFEVIMYSEGDDYDVQTEAYSQFRMVTEATGATAGAFFQLGEIEFFGVEAGKVNVSINFGANEPDGAGTAVVAGTAGVLGSANWNNVETGTGADVPVNADVDGEVVEGVTVSWAASGGTWASTGRGEENNTAPDGDDRNLMTGYLDSNADDASTVTVSGLDAVTDGEYSVLVYINGGVVDRGGVYAIEGQGDGVEVVDTAPFDGTYVDGENYIVFAGVTGASFTLTATPTVGGTRRAPINGIEVVVGAEMEAPDLGIFEDAVTVGNATIGETTFDGEVYTMTSNGSDIWTGGDHMQFAYKSVTGDFVAKAQITSRTDPVSDGQWGKHGIMARQSLDVASRFDMIQTNLTSEGNTVEAPRFAKRSVHLVQDGMDEIGGFTSDPNGIPDGSIQGYDPNASPFENRRPEHMMMVRNGTWISSYVAFDDGEGNPLGWCYFTRDNDPDRPDTLLVGMALTSHTGDDGPPGTIQFTMSIDQPSSVGASPGDEIASRNFEDGEPLGVIVDNGNFTPAVVDGRLRVAADAIGSQANAIYYGVPSTGDGGAPLLADGFAAEFDVTISKEGGCETTNPADGMTFVVVGTGASDGLASAFAAQPGLEIETLLGNGGGALAYGGGGFAEPERQRCHPHFSVEIDNWVGGGGGTDPVDGGRTGQPGDSCNWHVGLNEFGSVTSLQTNVDFGVPTEALPDIWAADGVHVEVIYQATGQVDTYVSANDGSSGRIHVLSRKILPLGAQDVVVGFTGATGGATANYDVDNLVVSSLCEEDGADSVAIEGCPDEAVDVGANVTLTANVGGADGAVTYAWSVSGGTIVGDANGESVEIVCDAEGTVVATVTTSDGACDNEVSTSCRYDCMTTGVALLPGDGNLDGDLNISDPVAELGDLFAGLSLPACLRRDGALTAQGLAVLDWNGDGKFDISDPVATLNNLFGANFPGHVLGADCLSIQDEGDCAETCTTTE